MGTDRRVIHLPLPFDRPPLNANQRLHWRRKADITRTLRDAAHIAVKQLKLAPCEHISVTLHFAPGDRRRRDADNLVPTLKALCDGLVDAGLVADDTPHYMAKAMPVIDPPPAAGPRCWLTIEVTE
jgi:crossover junction endodeoxyribonuclease RusA